MFPEPDLFYLYRFALATVCGIYTVLQIAHTLWRWHLYLSPSRRETAVLRRYIIVQLLRLRISRFVPDLIQIMILTGLLAYLVALHHRGP